MTGSCKRILTQPKLENVIYPNLISQKKLNKSNLGEKFGSNATRARENNLIQPYLSKRLKANLT